MSITPTGNVTYGESKEGAAPANSDWKIKVGQPVQTRLADGTLTPEGEKFEAWKKAQKDIENNKPVEYASPEELAKWGLASQSSSANNAAANNTGTGTTGQAGAGAAAANGMAREMPAEQAQAAEKAQGREQGQDGLIKLLVNFLAQKLGLDQNTTDNLAASIGSSLAGNSTASPEKVAEVAKNEVPKVSGIRPEILNQALQERAMFQSFSMANASTDHKNANISFGAQNTSGLSRA